jgi:predicted transcriptional regulator
MSARLKKAKIGVMPLAAFKKRTLDIARGHYRPKQNEPKIWFHSMRSLANVLSEQNQALLSLIINAKPQSISDLEPLTGRKPNNLLRTLRVMENYGFVALTESKVKARGRAPLIPKVLYDTADIELHFG